MADKPRRKISHQSELDLLNLSLLNMMSFLNLKKQPKDRYKIYLLESNKISERCDLIAKTVEESEAYSYQFNVKIVGVPEIAEKESAQQTANLCIKLFTALGAEDVSLNDIGTAHQVPS
ncbi:Hypothetical predicted protein, partial [Paramuricea clavata]